MSLLRPEILEELKQLCENHAVDTFYIFGSRATGEGSVDSDYDFLVRFSSEISLDDYGKNYFDLLEALQSLMQSPVDLLTESSIKNPVVLKQINNEKQLIYSSKVATVARFQSPQLQ